MSDYDPESDGSVVIVLRPRLTLALLETEVGETLQLGGQAYQRVGWGGFYDWLRDPAQQLIGVRFFPFGEETFIINEVRRLPYVHVKDGNEIQIYFGQPRPIDEWWSSDQWFDNKLMAADKLPRREYAIVLSTFCLNAQEIHMLAQSEVDWITA